MLLRAAACAVLAAAALLPTLSAAPARAADLPGVPSSIGGQSGDRSITVTWGAPVDTDLSTLTGFVVCLDISYPCVVLGPNDRQRTFSGLAFGSRYYPSVAATTSAGQGPSLQLTGGVLAAGAPNPPIAVEAVRISGRQVRISWSGVDGPYGPPTRYTVTGLGGADPHYVDVASWDAAPPDPRGAQHYFVDMDLHPGWHFDFFVTATNGVGTSDPSHVRFSTSRPAVLLPGDVVEAGTAVVSNGYFLVQQTDGNVLVNSIVDRTGHGRTIWHSWTWGHPAGRLAFQEDGNLVAYDRAGAAIWHTGTWGHPDAALTIEHDGRVVIFDGRGAVLWSSRADTGRGWQTGTLGSAEQMTAGQTLYSPNSVYRFTLQPDGNAVVYGPGGRVLWHSWTFGRPGSRLVLQDDGNLVLYTPDRRAAWHAGTWGNPGSRLVIQDDGNLVVYAADGRPLWSSMYGRVR